MTRISTTLVRLACWLLDRHTRCPADTARAGHHLQQALDLLRTPRPAATRGDEQRAGDAQPARATGRGHRPPDAIRIRPAAPEHAGAGGPGLSGSHIPAPAARPASTSGACGPESTVDTPPARPLADHLPGRPAGHRPVVVLADGPAVVLGALPDGWIRLYRARAPHLHLAAATTPATPMTDAAGTHRLLVEAAIGLHAALVLSDARTERARRTGQAALRQARAAILHHVGSDGPDTLNALLDEAGLDRCQPRARVRFTLTGHYDTDLPTGTADEAARAARTRLRPDLSDLPVCPHSVDYHLDADAAVLDPPELR